MPLPLSLNHNLYLEKIAARYSDWYESIPQIKKMNTDIKQFHARIQGLRNARKLLLTNNAFAGSTKRRYERN